METESLYLIMNPHKMDWDDLTSKGNEEMKATAPQKFWMITGDGNSPKMRHYNMQDAQNEATRLARANPGIEFFVLQSVEMVEQPAGLTRHRF